QGLILANEVADALPCRRFTCRARGVRELGVAPGEGADPLAFHEQYAAADASLAQACRELRAALPAPLPEGYTSEVCLRVAPWIAALSECLEGLVAEADDTVQRARLAGEARRLIMPEEMGEAFKVMALTRGCDVALAGFALQDLRHLL